MIDGEMDAGAWSCGMVVGLIHDVPTVKELIDRIMAEADQIIRGRLMGFLDDAEQKMPIRAVSQQQERWIASSLRSSQ
jgi:nitronate monooxygenase